MERGRLQTITDIKDFIFAGNATFTVVSEATGVRFTYRVRQSDDGRVYFVKVLVGPDNESSYAYAGIIRNNGGPRTFTTTRASKVGKDAPSVKGFEWLLRRLNADEEPNGAEVWHEGRCGRCGRTLTVPESIARGIGPTCAGQM